MVIVSIFLLALLSINTVLVYASTSPPSPSAATTTEPKPGIIMIITFENGTTKAIHSDSTNLRAVQGGYFIADSSVKASQPIQSKTVSNTVVQQLVSVFVDVSIDEPPPESPIAPEQRGGACAALYTYNPETGQCELPSLPSEPVLDPEPDTTDEELSPAVPAEPVPDPGNGDQNDGSNEEVGDGGGDGDGSTEGEGDSSDEEESEE